MVNDDLDGLASYHRLPRAPTTLSFVCFALFKQHFVENFWFHRDSNSDHRSGRKVCLTTRPSRHIQTSVESYQLYYRTRSLKLFDSPNISYSVKANNAKVGSKFCQILKNLAILPKTLKFCQKAKMSPNLVTLVALSLDKTAAADANIRSEKVVKLVQSLLFEKNVFKVSIWSALNKLVSRTAFEKVFFVCL